MKPYHGIEKDKKSTYFAIDLLTVLIYKYIITTIFKFECYSRVTTII